MNILDSNLIELALQEDLNLPYLDITTSLLFSETKNIAKANIVSKHPEPIVICGLTLIPTIAAKLSSHCEVDSIYRDGDTLLPGATLFTLTGPVTALLMLERTMLNFLQRLCAIATLTAKFVHQVQATNTKILDTRKTTPGLRHLEKYAVNCGGGVNHRMGLHDAIMIKDTHIDFLGGIKNALVKLPDNIQNQYPVIVEVRTKEELSVVLKEGLSKVTRVLLDNMSLPYLSDCVRACNGIISTEASGNITLDNVAAVADCGVDFISVGKLTHSANSVDLSMQCKL